MKKNLYYQSVYSRRNTFSELLLNLFFSFSSIPRLLIEVFLRKNFGERYFNFSTAILTGIALALIPIGLAKEWFFFLRDSKVSYYSFWEFWFHFLTWYLFVAGFLFESFKRFQEVERLPSVFDFARFSLSTGEIHPAILNYQFAGKTISVRSIEMLIEPGIFFIIGLFLWICQQTIGEVLLVSSIVYCLSYNAAYVKGDHFIMDTIDKHILGEETAAAFIHDQNPSKTRGVKFYGRKPANPDLRRIVAENFIEYDDIVEVK